MDPVTFIWDTESVICDVIKISLKRKDERRDPKKGNPTKKMDLVFFL